MKYKVCIKIEYYVEEIIEAEDYMEAEDIANDIERGAVEHASEDVQREVYCLNCEEGYSDA